MQENEGPGEKLKEESVVCCLPNPAVLTFVGVTYFHWGSMSISGVQQCDYCWKDYESQVVGTEKEAINFEPLKDWVVCVSKSPVILLVS